MLSLDEAQRAMTARFGVETQPPAPDVKVGIAKNVTEGLQPLHALRHPPEGDTCGWYVWAGEDFPDADGFVALHVVHLPDWCPELLPYLGLPPGWRVLLAPGYEDVWFDEALLDISG